MSDELLRVLTDIRDSLEATRKARELETASADAYRKWYMQRVADHDKERAATKGKLQKLAWARKLVNNLKIALIMIYSFLLIWLLFGIWSELSRHAFR